MSLISFEQACKGMSAIVPVEELGVDLAEQQPKEEVVEAVGALAVEQKVLF